MATKRSRAAFEDDLRKKESPYAFYGTPLPPLDAHTRDDGSYVPVWQQEVRDERGRKRLHGAFTGGFSAGYFNTVGSKEGWTPQTFVSSRTNRAKAQQRPEDFMDDEDIAAAEEAKQLQTASGFSGLGGTADELGHGNAIMDLTRPGAEESMGVKLLQKMGWKQGQGVGPKIRRKARGDDDEGQDGSSDQTHLFAPDNSAMISFVKKIDFKGLGYAGEASLERPSQAGQSEAGDNDDDEDSATLAWSRAKAKTQKLKPKVKKSSFGVGVLNDTGSDDEDPYEMGPKISYNRTIGGNKKAKAKPVIGGANPLLAARPVFTSKKNNPSKTSSGFRKCHDGRLPLDGFVLSMDALTLSTAKYAPPKIPDDWKSKLIQPATPTDPNTRSTNEEWQSTADAAKSSTLDPTQRATLLGEETLPGKSIFDFITPTARNKLATATNRTDLPQGLGESAPPGYALTPEAKQKQLQASIPPLSKAIAQEALQRGVNGWMPYAEDDAKRARYRSFLELKAGLRADTSLPEKAPGHSTEDWLNELREFAQAAEVFRPMTGVMALKFTTSSRTYEGSHTSDSRDSSLLTNPLDAAAAAKKDQPQDPAEQAAKIGMYGPLTRSILPFHPTRLLCKRLNIRPPASVAVDPSGNEEYGIPPPSSSSSRGEMVPRKALERAMQDAAIRRFAARVAGEGNGSGGAVVTPVDDDGAGEERQMQAAAAAAVVDVERNEALEGERPGDAVFRAIFGSDEDEDEDDD